MKTTYNSITETTLEKFAEQHDLEMVITDRSLPVGDAARYYAAFKKSDVKEGSMLRGEHGNGATHTDALIEYTHAISQKTLVIDAWGDNRRVIQVPRLVSVK